MRLGCFNRTTCSWLGSWLVALIWLTPQVACAEVGMVFNSYGWSSVYRVGASSTTGAAVLLPPENLLNTTFLSSTDAGPDGRVYGTISDELWAIDVSAPIAKWEMVTHLDDSLYGSLAFGPGGDLYLEELGDVSRFNATTGDLLSSAPLSLSFGGRSLSIQGMDFSPAGDLFVVDTRTLYRVDLATGIASALYTNADTSKGIFTELDYGVDGVIRGLSYFDRIFSYDVATGTGSWSSWKLSYNGSSFSPSALATVPEPHGLVLALLCLPVMLLFAAKASLRRRDRG